MASSKPKIGVRQTRSKSVIVRLTQEEYQLILNASANQRSFSEWLRAALLAAAEPKEAHVP